MGLTALKISVHPYFRFSFGFGRWRAFFFNLQSLRKLDLGLGKDSGSITSGDPFRRFQGHFNEDEQYRFLQISKVASGSDDETVKLWDVIERKGRSVCRRWRGILQLCDQCVVFSRWDEGCVGV